jgi:AraC-like DNA-binding protein
VRIAKETIQVPGGHSFRLLHWNRRLSDVSCIVAPGKTTRVAGEGMHWHYHVEMELTLFTSGAGTRFVGDHIGPFAAGDLVLLGERLPHYWHTGEISSGVSVQWHFPDSHPFWAFPENLVLAELFKRAGRGLRVSGVTARDVATQMQELSRHSGPAQLAILMTMLARLADAADSDLSFLSMRSFALSAESHYQQAIAKSVRHLIAHFREEVRLEELLQATKMSRPTFARQFKKHSGRSFSEFLNRIRLQAACRELEGSERSILEIALTSGFTQISFFNRLFRRAMRCSPTEYRARHRRKHRPPA